MTMRVKILTLVSVCGSCFLKCRKDQVAGPLDKQIIVFNGQGVGGSEGCFEY